MFAILDISTPYKIVALLHLLTVVAAFGPLFLYPALRRNGDTSAVATLHMRLVFPSLILLWVLGMGLAGMSTPDGADDNIYEVSQLWLTLSILVWVILVAVSWFLIRPALTDRSESATSKLAAGVGITHLGLVVGLILMIWKPGL